MTIRERKGKFYQWLFTWAVKQWRKTFNNPLLGNKEGKLTTHAIVRYLERIERRDMYAEIVTPEVKAMIKKIGGSGKFVVNNIQFTVDKGRILTLCRPNPGAPVMRGLNKDSDVPRLWSF